MSPSNTVVSIKGSHLSNIESIQREPIMIYEFICDEDLEMSGNHIQPDTCEYIKTKNGTITRTISDKHRCFKEAILTDGKFTLHNTFVTETPTTHLLDFISHRNIYCGVYPSSEFASTNFISEMLLLTKNTERYSM